MSDENKTEVPAEPSETKEVETFTKDQVQKLVDSEISRAVNKYKENSYQKDLEAGIKKTLEDREKKTPDQIAMEELRSELEQERNLRIKKEKSELIGNNTKTAMEALSGKKLPVELAKFIASDDPEKTQENLNSVTEVLEALVTSTKQGILNGNNVEVPGKTQATPTKEEISWKEKMKETVDKVR